MTNRSIPLELRSVLRTGYARRYEHKKRREALDRLKEKKKEALVADPDDEDDDDSDDESDEDEAVAAASRRVDRRVLQVIRRIRSGDSAIFDKDAKVYSSSEDEDEDGAEGEPKEGKKAKKERPLYLKDVNAQHLLEEGPEFAAQAGRGSKYDRIAYNELQREGLKEFLEAEKKALGDGDDEEEDLFKAKQAEGDGGDSEEDEDEKQTEELLGEVFGDDDKLDDNEKFLKNYILNRPYLEPAPEKFSLDDIQEVSQEEDVIETQEDYEDIYNKLGNYKFRHEEVEASEGVVTDRVMGHPRVVEGSVRKKESSRKKQRKSKEERLARAKQEQAEELKHLKNLKKKEIAEKLEKIRMIAGIEGEAACKLGADDLEEDFDPEDYDRKMQEMFDDSYYGADEVDPGFGSGDDLDLVKPDFDKEDELLGLPKDWAPDGKEGSTATGEKKKKKKKNKELANGEEEGEKKKGKISLKDKVELEKELDEYYKLDYEDTIGDLKTRFKYRQVQPNSFGLETYEILQSDDRDLNQYVSMKKLAPYREDEWQGSKGAPSSGGLPLWKQVSISDALLTNEILVMRRIVENVAPHPNVISLHDVYEDAHGVHLVLELCSGGELFDRIIGRERYSEFDAAAVVRQIAGAHHFMLQLIKKSSKGSCKCADGENATLTEFEQVLKAMKMDSLIPLGPRVFDLFDNNRDGTVDMREILCGLSSLRNSRGDDALRLCFQMYDADRSGCISKEELASMLRALPEECLPGDIAEPGKLDEMFDTMDANGDGEVTFDEFKAAMQKDSALQDVVLSSLRPGQQ
ncbi:Calcium and calcium/calmodulin-dependent serine/threonine-protein kinase [Triticum urartu]|uniref:Calcium and calcium/calmodulin-dependent serine/threonine-protein kinase n=1 Tax=Triticum urartu TaxID=4572 RepID=M7ZMG3_TRIUA|nr:Calcium and calcium/calmodulin-dependent serine/threonine-protein kinase [Triticum urartu]